MMNETQKILSDIVVYTKYAKFIPSEERRERWDEIVDRYVIMMLKKYCGELESVIYSDLRKDHTPISIVNNFLQNFDNDLSKEIITNSIFIYTKKLLMSMRAAQFAGVAIEKNESRIYNCSYLPIDHHYAFSEVMFLLLGGTGVGYSVQAHHIEQLPEIRKPNKERKYLVSDSIEGWADAIKALMKAYFGFSKSKPRFDFSDIRAKGERLVTAGGKAPGPEPLKKCLFNIELLLERKNDGEKLTSLEVHDILCYIADAVLAGGIRRAAMIALFSADDQEMRLCKHGNWWENNPQRGRANNSAVILRHKVEKKFFNDLWTQIKDSNSGEPGIYLSNDKEYGTNPCCEIALRPFTFCNLTEINGGDLESQRDFNERCRAAAFFGTLQAGFTDFHYLRDIWKHNTEKDALIGGGITGICNGAVLDYDLGEAAEIIKNENERVAGIIGINTAARTTTVKPSGSTSCVLGTFSGVHSGYSKYYIRNIQCAVGDDLYNFFIKHHPHLIKIMDYDPKSAVIGIPQKAPNNGILRDNENALDMLERVKKFNLEWVRAGHRRGANTNNVSATVYIDEKTKYMPPNINDDTWTPVSSGLYDEWEMAGDWMWNNREYYNGLSVLPYDSGSYKDAPFIEITEEEFLERMSKITPIDLTLIKEQQDNTDQKGQIACAGGSCEII